MQETQDELSAWKFTPDSATGKRLMAKCRQLLQENEDIGKMISSGRLAKLETELAMQKRLCEEMKKNQVSTTDPTNIFNYCVVLGIQTSIFVWKSASMTLPIFFVSGGDGRLCAGT